MNSVWKRFLLFASICAVAVMLSVISVFVVLRYVFHYGSYPSIEDVVLRGKTRTLYSIQLPSIIAVNHCLTGSGSSFTGRLFHNIALQWDATIIRWNSTNSGDGEEVTLY